MARVGPLSRGRAAIAALILVAGSMLVVVPMALAGTAMSISPNIPFNNAAVTVGDTGVASTLTIHNLADQAQATGIIRVTTATVTTAAGVFSLSATGHGVSPACTGSTWNITGGPTTWTFTPTTNVDLTSLNGTTPANSVCEVDFTVNILMVPTPNPTLYGAGVTGKWDPTGQNLDASGTGSGSTTINKITPTLPTTPSAGGPIGTVLNDSATVTGGSSPTGSVDFKLFPPSDATCAGTAVYSQTVALTAGTAATSPGYTSLVAGTYRWTAHYGGDGNNNVADSGCQAEQVVISNPHTGEILPTNTTCSDFVNGTTPALAQINYTVNGGKIGQSINPGVFFYYTYVTTTTANQAITTSQHAGNSAPLFQLNQGHVWVYRANCTLVSQPSQADGATTVSATIATPGTYVLRIQYSTKSIAGQTAPTASPTTYHFDINGVDNASVPLVIKP